MRRAELRAHPIGAELWIIEQDRLQWRQLFPTDAMARDSAWKIAREHVMSGWRTTQTPAGARGAAA